MVVLKFIIDERGAERRIIVKDYVGGRRLQFEPFSEGPGMQVCWWWRYFQQPPVPSTSVPAPQTSSENEGGKGGGRWLKKRMERLVSLNVANAAIIPAGTELRWTDEFPADGGEGARGFAGWSWYPAGSNAEDELMFPKGAEIVEIEDVNGDWYHGFYAGQVGLLPGPYVKFGRDYQKAGMMVGMIGAVEV